MKNKAKVIIVHGWASTPNRGWIKWLRHELVADGYEVEAPAMPSPRQPDIEAWIEAIKQAAGNSKRLILVGHSLGTYALLEFIKTLPATVKVEKLILVAGFYVTKEDTYWPKHYLESKDFVRINKRIAQSYIIYSNNDRMVEPNRSRALAQELKANLILQPERRHFSNLKQKKLDIVLACITDKIVV